MKLFIIESPGKIHTLQKILGPEFTVLPTIGHMRIINDSGAYNIGIDCRNNFKIDYAYDRSKKDSIRKIKDAAKNAEVIYLCSDADKEGHLIAEEIADLLKQYKSKFIRTTFNEITEKAVKEAIKNPTGFNKNMAYAAEARGCIDKIMGYRCSNISLSKLGAPSVGRVQSALLKLLAEKENSIKKFKPITYYDVFSDMKKGRMSFTSKLFQISDKKVEKIQDKKIADNVVISCQDGEFIVSDIKEKIKEIEPKLPLTTASMQQLASNVLGFSPARTQKSAQKLYELGMCTYIRSDSHRFSDEFISSAKDFIEKKYGKEYYRGLKLPAEKNKNVQDGHEAIRPTDVKKTPDKVVTEISGDELKLYKLIYNYSIASLFVPAKVKDTDVIFSNGEFKFKLSGRQITYESFLSIIDDLDGVSKIPEFKKGEIIFSKNVYIETKETQPPQRYSESGLVKLMESSGIGRPSTFSPTIEILKKREYIKIEKKAVHVTEMGMKLSKMLSENFKGIFDAEYTSKMEENLDKIAQGEITELSFLNEFWNEFEPIVLKAAREINKDKPKPESVGRKCPDCGKDLVYREGKNGRFVACSNFPRCKHTESVEKKEIGPKIQCPECGDGLMVLRKSKKGSMFYGCNRWPACNKTLTEDAMKEYLIATNRKVDNSADRD